MIVDAESMIDALFVCIMPRAIAAHCEGVPMIDIDTRKRGRLYDVRYTGAVETPVIYSVWEL